jgi:hypothetical protein
VLEGVKRLDNLLKAWQIVHVGFIVEDREKAMERLGELYGITEWQMVEWRPSRLTYTGVDQTDA